ncbi:hypothetical protein [Streptomyces sp. PanSC9]|uniref:hypothetical protein n=1 Tax=Streptomyces sp. PanSC9 TaxID=1520461 RepID=UPI0011CD9173|nr:hypothetical protein [Streptomyces sp. PanSC9]
MATLGGIELELDAATAAGQLPTQLAVGVAAGEDGGNFELPHPLVIVRLKGAPSVGAEAAHRRGGVLPSRR